MTGVSAQKSKKMRKSFVFYACWWEAIKNLPRDVQGDVLAAIIEYGLSGETHEQLKPVTKALLAMVKPQIDMNYQRFENGHKGGRPLENGTEQKPDKNQTKTKQKPNKNQAETKTEPNDNNISSPTSVVEDITPTSVGEDNTPPLTPKGFVPPSLDEMCRFFDEKGYTQEAAEKAFNYYTELGWKDSKGNRVKNWKLKCINVWFKPEFKKSSRPKRPWGDHGIAL